MTDVPLEEFRTIRDFLRHAVTEFTRAALHFGHGAGGAVDEAAFLILEALALPIDDVNPWLDARLSMKEQKLIADLIRARVKTRIPAAYLINKAYIQGVPFYVDERVIVPRSYIGEILFGEFVGESDLAIIPDPDSVESVLDLCTGSGALAILAATIFPNAEVHATELSPDALAVARRNVEEHGLEDRITLFEGDLFEPLPRGRYDLILANPPYVDSEAMANLPPEYRAEPPMALAGGADGFDLVRRILETAPDWLADEGGLLCEIGAGRENLEAEYGQLDFFWPDTEEGAGEVFWLTAADFGR